MISSDTRLGQGAWLVNTARGAICDKDAVATALKSGRLRGSSIQHSHTFNNCSCTYRVVVI